MTVKEEIMLAITETPGMTDTEIEKRFNRSHQTINQNCRELEKNGYLVRQANSEKNNYLGNYPTEMTLIPKPKPQVKTTNESQQTEDSVKQYIKEWLELQGWSVNVAWGKKHGIDIDAHRGNERWIIEVKGPGSLEAMRHNYFIGILGETLQRMNDDNAHYSIAFPDMKVYRGLWSRLPAIAKERTQISLLLVTENGTVSEIN